MLIKCKECKNKVSENAVACPKCGNPITPDQLAEARMEAKIDAWASVLAFITVGIFIVYFFIIPDNEPANKPLTATDVLLEKEHKIALAEVRLERFIKENMNNPDSYDHVRTIHGGPGDTTNSMKMKIVYRGSNVFGGIVENWILAEVNTKTGQINQIIETGP